MGRVIRAAALVALLLCAADDAEGQKRRGPGGFVGVSFIAADPVGEMGTLVDDGFGLELAGAAPVAADGMLRLRADLGFLVYGIERIDYCTWSCRIGTELTTTNAIVFGGVGPELVFGNGPVQPYVHGSAGLSYFVTSSSLNDHDGTGSYLDTTNYSDVVFALRYGGGVRMRVGGARRVFIDLGLERHRNGIAEYLTAGDIVDNADGSVTIYPNRSEADLVSFRVGVSFGIH